MNRAVFAAVFLKRFLLVLAEYAAQNSIFIVENITVRVTQQTRIFFSVDFEQVIDGFGKLKILVLRRFAALGGYLNGHVIGIVVKVKVLRQRHEKMHIVRVVLHTDAALSHSDALSPFRSVAVRIDIARIKAKQAVALFGGREVVRAHCRVVGVVHVNVPCAFEPLVLPRKEKSSAAASLADICGHARVEPALFVLVQAALLIVVYADMRHSARGGQAVLRDKKRPFILRFQVLRIHHRENADGVCVHCRNLTEPFHEGVICGVGTLEVGLRLSKTHIHALDVDLLSAAVRGAPVEISVV